MTSRHLADPDLIEIVEQFSTMRLSPEALVQMRAEMVRTTIRPQSDSKVAIAELKVPGPSQAPDVRILIYSPVSAASDLPAFIHIHGGGYITGNPEGSDPRNRRLAVEANCIVISVDYRVAPETVFPGPLEDCYAVLKWVYQNAGSLGVDRQRIGIGGESAGGGLAAGLALLARDRAEVPVVFQLLIYPMIDDRTCADGQGNPFAGEFVWTRESNRFGWSCFLGHAPGAASAPRYAAAARETDLAGLPPAFVGVGTLDLFLDENIDYARRLTRAGVATELHVYPGGVHGFDRVPDARITKAFQRDYFDALRLALHGRQ